MNIKLTFLGAAGSVTGSRYLVEANGMKFLVDCGIFQERELRGRDWAPFPVLPKTIDAVLLTHGHLDHCGLLPKVAREGLHCPIYTTTATAEIARIMLLDSAKLQQEDAEFKKRRHERERRKVRYPEIPLYTTENVQTCLPMFSAVGYGKTFEIGKGIEVTFHDAGHVLGSAMIEVRIRQNKSYRTLLFSGDVGRWGQPILCDPTLFQQADYVLVESTYGDRDFDIKEDGPSQLAAEINRTVKAGGNIVIPAFALERSQEILYYLNELLSADRIPHLLTFVDSPMAVNLIDVFENHPELCDQDMAELLHQKKSPFRFSGLNLVRTVDESKAINHMRGTAIIIAGSGMCTGGRIKHHLVTNISRPESTILFVGYQAVGTLGRQIVDGAKEVRILGQHYPVKARVVQLTASQLIPTGTGFSDGYLGFANRHGVCS